MLFCCRASKGRTWIAVSGELVASHYGGLTDFKALYFTGQALTRMSPGILLGNDPTIALPMTAYYFLFFLAALILLWPV